MSFADHQKCIECDKNSWNGLTHPSCKKKHSIDGVFCALSYKGTVKKLLYSLKYKPYVSDLQNTLGELLREGLSEQETLYTILQSETNLALVPIPLHSSKFNSRGYNQSELLAKTLSEQWNIPVVQLLSRIKKTSPQFGLKKEDRFANIAGAFEVIRQTLNVSRVANVLLVDDLLTTGATLAEAARVLKKTGVKKVWGITLAID